MKHLKRESERRDKRWAQSVDLTHSIHPLFLHHPLLVHAFTPPTPPFFALAFVLVLPVCLWPAECGCHGERAKVSAPRGRERDEAIVKATALFSCPAHFPPKLGLSRSEPQYCRWKGVERLRHGGTAAVCCSTAPRPASWGAVQRRAQLKELRHKAKPFADSSTQFLCAFIQYVSIHSVNIFGGFTVVFWLCLRLCTCTKLSAVILNAYECRERFRTFTVCIFFICMWITNIHTKHIFLSFAKKNDWEIWPKCVKVWKF